MLLFHREPSKNRDENEQSTFSINNININNREKKTGKMYLLLSFRVFFNNNRVWRVHAKSSLRGTDNEIADTRVIILALSIGGSTKMNALLRPPKLVRVFTDGRYLLPAYHRALYVVISNGGSYSRK